MKLICAILLALIGATNIAFAFQVPQTVDVPAGKFIYGSDNIEREYAYRLDEQAYGHSITRQNRWYDDEPQRQTLSLPAFKITQTLITNDQYALFVQETGHRKPFVDQKTWDAYGLVHPFERAQKFNWLSHVGPSPHPSKRKHHPVVLVSYKDARAYADWLSKKTGKRWQLPSPQQWQKAARGTDGRYFPWGNTFDLSNLNSHDNGPFFTQSVYAHKSGASPYDVLDMAGNVFEWTSSDASSTKLSRQFVVGGSWDDKGCGVCRAAARHTRPINLKHILIGFRLVQNAPEAKI